MIDPSIFKAYDVRGIYPDQLDEELAYRIGRAFARVLGEPGGQAASSELRRGDRPRHAPHRPRDGRAATPRGLADEGADVLDIGMVGTEMVYYASARASSTAG